MTRKRRGLIGALAMIAFVCCYALLAMVLAQAPVIQHASILVQTVTYAVLGLAWIAPLMPLIKWMERRDEPPNDSAAIRPLRDIEAAAPVPGRERKA